MSTKSRKLVILLFAIAFLITFLKFNSALALEVDYPVLATGAKITSQTDFPNYLKYVFDFGIFAGFVIVFFTLVFAGVLYLLSPAVPNALAIARDRVSGAISGLLILATLYLIATTINPSLRIFTLDELEEIPLSQQTIKETGVYFHNHNQCKPPVPESPHIANVPHLGDLANRVSRVDIVHNRDNNGLCIDCYISVLYDSPDFFGKCQYINPNKACDEVKISAVSASIYKYEHRPKGDGVYFNRKSFFNREGGWLRVPNSNPNSKIGPGIFVGKLSEMKFNGNSDMKSDNPNDCTVPKSEQDCKTWNNKGECIERKCPTLAGENISSIEIKGNYMVMLIYWNQDKPEPNSTNNGPWAFCQEFPTKDDADKEGPKQIKWESVRNISLGQLPNYVLIFPLKEK